MNGAISPLAHETRTTNRSPLPHPTPVPFPVERALPSLLLLVAALPSALLLYLAFFPVAWGFLGWVALVPFLLLVRGGTANVARYATAYVVGLLFYLPVLQWISVADPRMVWAWFGLTGYCALYFPLALLFIRFIDQKTRLPLVLSVPVAWTALEFFRSTFCTGFGWYQVGHTQHDYLPIIQIADLAGVYGVTFLVVAGNALLAESLCAQGWFRRAILGPVALPRYSASSLLVQALGVVVALLATLGYGYWRLADDDYQPGPRVALIQGNLDQRLRNSQQEGAGKEVQFHYESLSLLSGSKEYHPDLIVWPETSYPWAWEVDSDGGLSADNFKDAQKFTAASRTNILLGLNVFQEKEDAKYWRYNSAVLLSPNGVPAGRYDKIHRVVFGEYIPLVDWIPLMNKLSPYDFEYSIHSGEGHPRFAMDEPAGEQRRFTFGVVICYEDTDPDMARPYGGGDGQRPADFLLNTSNDGWFDGSSEHEQHLAICRFRAIECRRSVLRSVNMGVSAVIDGNGRVLQPELLGVAHPPPEVEMSEEKCPRVWDVSPQGGGKRSLPVSQWHEFKKVQGVLLATVPLDNRTSFYAVWGDWLPWVCWLLLAPVVAVMAWRMVAGVGRLTARFAFTIRKPVAASVPMV